MNPAYVSANVVPYVQVRHAIHLLYATSPRSRDGSFEAGRPQGLLVNQNHRFDKAGNRLPLELHGCGCSLCGRQQRTRQQYWQAR